MGHNFRTRLIEEWKPQGLCFFEETLWSSSVQQIDLPKIRAFLSKNDIQNVDVALMRPTNNESCRTRWHRYYNSSGQCISSNHQVPIPVDSNHLKLTFGYKSAEERESHHRQVFVVAGAIRLVFGATAARELVFNGTFSEENPDAEFSSDVGYASPFDSQSLNLFENPPIEDTVLKQIPAEASILLDGAFVQPYPQERFILMWLAFEAIVHSFPGEGGNGEKRQRFCRQELRSDIVNKEVRRLFNFRNSIFKEGVFLNTKVDDECWSLYAVLQLAVMKDGPQRQAFLSSFEGQLKDKRA